MIFNVGALGYGVLTGIKKYKVKLNIFFLIKSLIIFILLFLISISVANSIRAITSNKLLPAVENNTYDNSVENNTFNNNFENQIQTENIINKLQKLIIERWVGIEGLLAVSSYDKKSWSFWKEAWDEKYSETKLSFFDTHLISSPYKYIDQSKAHYQTLPGILAFCFYPGSNFFLFFCLFFVGIFSSLIEKITFKLGDQNIILCALISQVVAYRFIHFGFSPSQSYLLFGAIFLNISLIYLFNKSLILFFQKNI